MSTTLVCTCRHTITVHDNGQTTPGVVYSSSCPAYRVHVEAWLTEP